MVQFLEYKKRPFLSEDVLYVQKRAIGHLVIFSSVLGIQNHTLLLNIAFLSLFFEVFTISVTIAPVPRISVTPGSELDHLLHPDLFQREPLFTRPLTPPANGEKIYDLTPDDIADIRRLRGAVVDLHPGMGGIAPDKLQEQIKAGRLLTSLDFMVTQGCNLECLHCFAMSGPQKKTFIPFSVLEQTVADAVELGTSLFVLTGGEPLVYRDPALGKPQSPRDHFFRIVDMIHTTAARADKEAKILVFDDLALVTPEIARRFADYKVGLCTKGDTLHGELQDYKVNRRGTFNKMMRGYQNLVDVGYGKDPSLRLVVNSVLDHTTFDGMVDLHCWVMDRGFDHSIVPIHFCGNAVDDNQEAGIHSPHVKVLYDLIARIDAAKYSLVWKSFAAFTYNKTCNRNRSGLHVRANGFVTACSESPGPSETGRYTFDNVLPFPEYVRMTGGTIESVAEYLNVKGKGDKVPHVVDHLRHAVDRLVQAGSDKEKAERNAVFSSVPYIEGVVGPIQPFSLKDLVASERLKEYRTEFAQGSGTYMCNPKLCDLNANDLCQGGCATRSAYSKIDPNTGFIVKNDDPECYSKGREDFMCPALTVLAERQGVLRPGLLRAIHERLLEHSTRISAADFPYQESA